jgi:hypothetical protein
MSEKINLNELFLGLQKQVEARFSTNRAFVKPPGSKGDSLENVWISWLREYLPNRYCVDKAFVIDSKGHLSDQLDLVIYDQHFTPFVFRQDGVTYIPVEGVYAIFEVKPDLKGNVQLGKESISYIEYAGRKIASVRKLHRTTTSIIDRGYKHPPRPLTRILGGILTVDCSFVKNETLENHLKSLNSLESIDMGCAVNHGSFYAEYESSEELNPKNLAKKISEFFENDKLDEIEKLLQKTNSKYYQSRAIKEIEFSNAEHSLVTFFLKLSRHLQTIGSVAAIDLANYASAINLDLEKGEDE